MFMKQIKNNYKFTVATFLAAFWLNTTQNDPKPPDFALKLLNKNQFGVFEKQRSITKENLIILQYIDNFLGA